MADKSSIYTLLSKTYCFLFVRPEEFQAKISFT